jgi:histone H3/H4
MMLYRHRLQLSFLKDQHADCPSFIQLGAVNMEINEVADHIAEVPTESSVPAAATAVIQTPKSGPFPLAPSQVDQVVKRTVPQGYHVSKDTKAAINKSANIFLLYMEALVSSERVSALHASKRHPPKRITISAADVKKALQDAGMSHLLPQMTSNKRSR